tara:strand:- start:207 stop:596 length:390 start_codon:yes stop_codon:yes gene_type:complete
MLNLLTLQEAQLIIMILGQTKKLDLQLFIRHNMAITKETKIARTEIVGDYNIIQIAEDIIYKEDGVVTNTVRHRRVLCPCVLDKNTDTNEVTTVWTDTSNEPQEIKDIINLKWTDEVKSSWETFLKGNV